MKTFRSNHQDSNNQRFDQSHSDSQKKLSLGLMMRNHTFVLMSVQIVLFLMGFIWLIGIHLFDSKGPSNSSLLQIPSGL